MLSIFGKPTVKVIHIYDEKGDKVAEKGVCDCDDCFVWWELLVGIAVGVAIWWIQALV